MKSLPIYANYKMKYRIGGLKLGLRIESFFSDWIESFFLWRIEDWIESGFEVKDCGLESIQKYWIDQFTGEKCRITL